MEPFEIEKKSWDLASFDVYFISKRRRVVLAHNNHKGRDGLVLGENRLFLILSRSR